MLKKLGLIATCLFVYGGVSLAQVEITTTLPEFVVTNAASRDGQDLSGSWSYSIDPYRDGLYGFHGSPSGYGHQRFDPQDVDTATRRAPAALFEYDMARSPRVTLPSSWTNHAPEMRHYEGLVWYSRTFETKKKRGERSFIRVGAANYTARVYLNGELAGTHEGGFTPFTFEVTDLVKSGENNVTIGVDSQRTDRSVPPPVTDWETYGGITRPVQFITTPETFIDDAWVRLDPDNRHIRVTVRLDGPKAADQPIRLSIEELGIDLHEETNADGIWTAVFPAPERLVRWSPEIPKLYDVTITTGEDELAERIGFRTISVEGEDILLNGKPVYLRGISMHEEELGRDPSRVMTEAAARALLTEIKDGLNGNFVRLAHYPHSESTVRLADEMGLLVWSEIPVYWRIDWEDQGTLDAARAMLAENILRDRNRASVVLWSVANETPVSEARNIFLNMLIDDVRALDDTRLVTAALLTSQSDQGDGEVARVDDPLVTSLDVMAVNTYNGWYGNVPLAEVHEISWVSDHGKPMIFSEYGAGAQAGFHEAKNPRKFTEEYQAEYYRQTLAMADRVPFLRGMSPWILKDFRSPRRQHPIYQQGWNRKGLISETGERKEAFGILAAYYRTMTETSDETSAE
ncbi:glycoside hydrolase family 2 protein [Parvularcula marina]|uniref:glycoside hydrolase family 2 protein n=1 Tax=Parvularcula marina TaxID=2292771 RepID=UPI003519372D